LRSHFLPLHRGQAGASSHRPTNHAPTPSRPAPAMISITISSSGTTAHCSFEYAHRSSEPKGYKNDASPSDGPAASHPRKPPGRERPSPRVCDSAFPNKRSDTQRIARKDAPQRGPATESAPRREQIGAPVYSGGQPKIHPRAPPCGSRAARSEDRASGRSGRHDRTPFGPTPRAVTCPRSHGWRDATIPPSHFRTSALPQVGDPPGWFRITIFCQIFPERLVQSVSTSSTAARTTGSSKFWA